MNFFKGILLSITSIFVTILILELSLEIFMPQAKNTSWRIQDDLTGTFLNIKNGKAKHEYIGETDRISVEYNFGRFHNRIYKDYQYIDNKENILILGDSHIFGWLLEDKNTFIYKLNSKFDDFNFINASAGGWSDIDSYNYLRKFCNKIKPKKILFFLNIDRAIDSNLMFFENDELIVKNREINLLKKKLNDLIIYNWLSENSNLFQLIKNLYVKSSNNNYVNYNKTQKKIDVKKQKMIDVKKKKDIDLELFLKLIDQITFEVGKCESEIFFINRGWNSKKKYSETKNNVFDYLQKKQENNSINFISLYDDISIVRINEKKYLLEEGHPNELGNNIMFNALFSKFKDVIK